MTTGDLIKARRKEIAMSAERLAEKVGVSPATIYRYEKGDIEKVPVDVIKDIAKALNTTPAYLMGWETSPAAPTIPAGFEPLPEMTTIPLVGSIACGTPITAEENIEARIGIPAAWRADFALTCHGDSMAPKICDGDIVCIRKQQEVENGEIAAVRIGEEATLKRFYRQGDTVLLQAENPTFARSSTPTTSSTKSKLKARRSGFAGGYKEFPCTIGQSAGA